MTYLYIDESGDLGFSDKGSKYFVLTCVKIDDEHNNLLFQRIPKKIRQSVLKKKAKKLAELKFSNSSVLIRERFLERVLKIKCEIYVLAVEKTHTQKKLKENLPILYNYLIKVLLENPLKNIKKNSVLDICLDRCMSVSQRENFESYIKTEFLYLFKELPDVNITHENSSQHPCLQVTDFVCGAFGHRYNALESVEERTHYSNIVVTKVVMEKTDLFKKKEVMNHAYLS